MSAILVLVFLFCLVKGLSRLPVKCDTCKGKFFPEEMANFDTCRDCYKQHED